MRQETLRFRNSWKEGILFFIDVSGTQFNELHATVTNQTARVGQGFHLSAYRKTADLNALGSKVGGIYYSYDAATHRAQELQRPGPWGNAMAIKSSLYFQQFLSGAEAFYRQCFGIEVAAAQPAFSSDDFPTLAPAAPQAPAPGIAETVPDPNAAPGWQPDARSDRVDMIVNRMLADFERYRKEGYKLF